MRDALMLMTTWLDLIKLLTLHMFMLVNSLKNEGWTSEVPSLLWEVQTALAQTCQGSDRRTRLMDTAPIRSCFGLDALSVRT